MEEPPEFYLTGRKPPVEACFFCSGHLPCRKHKAHVFDDIDLQMWIMGELTTEEFMERET